MNAYSVLGLYRSNHLPTNTISPTNGPENNCSCEIGYELLLGYYYADGLWRPMTAAFFCEKKADAETQMHRLRIGLPLKNKS
jgi:hypothetical protein